ncbi:hypothetical protein H9P43_008707 [Blastocladiella emersonii ATCC 22665]|nr:hypothetical protein H9P43_008707 [Blastocladiella emersonii ATCC 22665]
MPRATLQPRTRRPRLPPSSAASPFHADRSFLGTHRALVVAESFRAATLEGLRTCLSQHRWADALHLLLAYVRAPSPDLGVVWPAGVAVLRGLQSASDPRVTPQSVVRFLRALLSLDSPNDADRPAMAVELALHQVLAGEAAEAFATLEPLVSQYPFAEDERVLGTYALVAVQLWEADREPAEETEVKAGSDDDGKEEEEEEEEEPAIPAYQQQPTSSQFGTGAASQARTLAAQYRAAARHAFERLHAVHPASTRYLAHYTRFLSSAGLSTLIPAVLGKSLAALAACTPSPDLPAAVLMRSREHVLALVTSHAIELELDDDGETDPTLAAAWLDPSLVLPADGRAAVALTEDWLDSSTPASRAAAVAEWDFPVHSLEQWQLLTHLVYRYPDEVPSLFKWRRAWWFAFHLARHWGESAELVTYKALVMLAVVPEAYAAAREALWAGRAGVPPEMVDEVRAAVVA